jgi:glycosyltransferase involved in cell wall biosynthesis
VGTSSAAPKLLSKPIRLIFVGRLEDAKGAGRILDIVAGLRAAGLSVAIDMVGDGPQRREYERHAQETGISDLVNFHGWVPHDALEPLYEQAHIILLPSNSEGWPKVLGEAMAYGIIPIASCVGSVPQYLARFKVGRTFEASDLQGFVKAVMWYAEHENRWKEESASAVKAARNFSYMNYLKSVKQLLGIE